MPDPTTPCSGASTEVRPNRPAVVCTRCQFFDPQAEHQLPGFSGSTCTSFRPRDDAALRGGSSNT